MSEAFNPFAAPETRDDGLSQSTGNYENLAGVERGLRLIYFGICGIFLSAIVAGILLVTAGPLVLIGLAGVVISWLMLIIGPFFCLSAPEESGAKWLIGTSILFQLMGFFSSIAARSGVNVPLVVQLIAQFSGLVGGLLFIFFLMRIARFIGREDLRQKGVNVIIGAVVIFMIAGFAAYSMATGVGVDPAFGGVIAAAAAAIGGLVLFVMYANLINYLAKAISALRKGPSAGTAEVRYPG